MAAFVNARRRHEVDIQKSLAHMSYSAGVLGSMSLRKTLPRFEEVFKFGDEEKEKDIDRSKMEMLALAANLNRQALVE